MEKFFWVGRKVKIYNFIGLFFLISKLVEPETFTRVSCPDTEGLWEVWHKTIVVSNSGTPATGEFLSSSWEDRVLKKLLVAFA